MEYFLLEIARETNTSQIRVDWNFFPLSLMEMKLFVFVAELKGRHPIVLLPDHDLSCLIIMNCHEKLRHEGVEHVQNELRQQYWVLHSRATVRKILHQCSY